MSLVHRKILKFVLQKLKSMIFLENLPKFHLDLYRPRYNNSLQVSCLGMNFGRGWNPNLEGSYLPDYSKSEAEFWTQCKSRFYLRPLQFSALEPSPISGYSEYEAKIWTQCKSRFYLRPMKVSAPETSPILRYNECTKLISFSV